MDVHSVMPHEENAMDHLAMGGKVIAAAGFFAVAIMNAILGGGFLPESWNGTLKDVVTLAAVISALWVIWLKFLRYIVQAAKSFVEGVAHVANLSDALQGMQEDLGGLRHALTETIASHDHDIAAVRKAMTEELEENARQHAAIADQLARPSHG